MIEVGALEARVKERLASRILALGLLVAALVFAGLLLAARPAHAAEFTVNRTGDEPDVSAGDGACDVSTRGDLGTPPCTLRAAIEEANAASGADKIGFNIPDDPNVPGDEVKTIRPGSALPYITAPVTIDGYTQPGASENTIGAGGGGGTNAVLKIELDGTNAGEFESGLWIQASNSVVRGLVINRFQGDGLHVDSGSGNKIEGNFIGTDPSGLVDLGNWRGVFLLSNSNVVGGTSPAARNLISANDNSGICSCYGKGGDKMQGNLIGTDATGSTNLGNLRAGVALLNSNNSLVGGTEIGAANTIAFNGYPGVSVGIPLGASYGTSIGNRVLGNSIFSNSVFYDIGQGIDLGDDLNRTPNDPRDPDTGPNTLQNFPVISSATLNPDRTTTIKGTLNSTPSYKKRIRGKTRIVWRYFTIQLFTNNSGEDEGRLYSGQVRVRTNLSGDASFTVVTGTIPAGDTVTATATGAGGTSEFSDPVVTTEG